MLALKGQGTDAGFASRPAPAAARLGILALQVTCHFSMVELRRKSAAARLGILALKGQGTDAGGILAQMRFHHFMRPPAWEPPAPP
jgi:hypothetical protein